jgi:hypothetical protein
MNSTHQTNAVTIRTAHCSFIAKGDLLVKVSPEGIAVPYSNVLNTKKQAQARGHVSAIVQPDPRAIQEEGAIKGPPFVLMTDSHELNLHTNPGAHFWEPRTATRFRASLREQLDAQGFIQIGASDGTQYFRAERAPSQGAEPQEIICAVRDGGLVGFWFQKEGNDLRDRGIIINAKTQLDVQSPCGPHALRINAGPFTATIEEGDYNLTLKDVSWNRPPSVEDLKLERPEPHRDTKSSLIIRGQNTSSELRNSENGSLGACTLNESTRTALWRYAIELEQLQGSGVKVSHQDLGDALAYAIALANLSSPALVTINGKNYTATAGGGFMSSTSNPYDKFSTTRANYFLRNEATGETLTFTTQDARCIAWYGDYRQFGGTGANRGEHSPKKLAEFLGFTGQNLNELKVP